MSDVSLQVGRLLKRSLAIFSQANKHSLSCSVAACFLHSFHCKRTGTPSSRSVIRHAGPQASSLPFCQSSSLISLPRWQPTSRQPRDITALPPGHVRLPIPRFYRSRAYRSLARGTYHRAMATAASTRSKRKQPEPEDTSVDRPTKQRKPSIALPKMGLEAARNGTIEKGHAYDSDEPMSDGTNAEEDVMATRPAAAAETKEWQATIEKVVRNVVSIHFCQPASFDTEPAMSSEATGFVVDAEKGYIMTNRHVVGPGPFWGYALFDNHEEVRRRNTLLCSSRLANSSSSAMCFLCIETQYTTLASCASIRRTSSTCH